MSASQPADYIGFGSFVTLKPAPCRSAQGPAKSAAEAKKQQQKYAAAKEARRLLGGWVAGHGVILERGRLVALGSRAGSE